MTYAERQQEEVLIELNGYATRGHNTRPYCALFRNMSPTLTSGQQQQKDKKGLSSNQTTTTNSEDTDDSDNDDCTNIKGIRFVDYVDESQLHHVMNLVGRDLSEPYSVFTYRYFLYRFPHLCILAVPDTGDPNEEPIGCVVGKIDEEDGEGDDRHQEVDAAIEEEQEQEEDEASTSSGICNVDTTFNEYDEEIKRTRGGRTTPGDDSVISEQTTGYIGMLAVSEQYRRRGIGKALVHRVLSRMKDLNCQSATLETEVTNTTAQRLYQDCFGFIREELLVRYYLNWNDAYRLRLWFD